MFCVYPNDLKRLENVYRHMIFFVDNEYLYMFSDDGIANSYLVLRYNPKYDAIETI